MSKPEWNGVWFESNYAVDGNNVEIMVMTEEGEDCEDPVSYFRIAESVVNRAYSMLATLAPALRICLISREFCSERTVLEAESLTVTGILFEVDNDRGREGVFTLYFCLPEEHKIPTEWSIELNTDAMLRNYVFDIVSTA